MSPRRALWQHARLHQHHSAGVVRRLHWEECCICVFLFVMLATAYGTQVGQLILSRQCTEAGTAVPLSFSGCWDASVKGISPQRLSYNTALFSQESQFLLGSLPLLTIFERNTSSKVLWRWAIILNFQLLLRNGGFKQIQYILCILFIFLLLTRLLRLCLRRTLLISSWVCLVELQ